jgi:hypothetical protein
MPDDSERFTNLIDEIEEAKLSFKLSVDSMGEISPMAIISGKVDVSGLLKSLGDLMGSYDNAVRALVESKVDQLYAIENE